MDIRFLGRYMGRFVMGPPAWVRENENSLGALAGRGFLDVQLNGMDGRWAYIGCSAHMQAVAVHDTPQT